MTHCLHSRFEARFSDSVRVLAGEFSKLKLKPLGDGGTYLQSVKFKISDVLPESSVKVVDRVLGRAARIDLCLRCSRKETDGGIL